MLLLHVSWTEVYSDGWQSMIELSRTQDEEVGDGTTSVIILGKYPKFTQRYKCLASPLHFLANCSLGP